MTQSLITCPKCDKAYPHTPQYFVVINRTTYHVCWVCWNKYDGRKNGSNRMCVVCGEIQPDTMNRFPADGSVCIKCIEANEAPKKNEYIPRQTPQSGTVYFILAPALNRIKIGITIGDVEKRLKGIQGQSPAKLICLATIASDNATGLERNIQRRFDEYWLWGEWFSFADEIQEYIDNHATTCNLSIYPSKPF